MSLLPPPRLARSPATTPFPPAADPEAERLVAQVLLAYANLPFKGAPLVLPGDVVVVEDAWRAALETELSDLADRGLVRGFSLEAWLKAKVESDGTPAQQAQLRALIANLPPEEELRESFGNGPEIVDDNFYSTGLPADIMAVMHQPLVEIPVYRDLADLPVDDRPSEGGESGQTGESDGDDGDDVSKPPAH